MASQALYEPRTEITFEVNVKRLEGLPHRSIFQTYKKRKLYVALSAGPFLDLKTKANTRGEDEKVTWDESFTFTVPMESNSKESKAPLANFAIYRAHGHSNDEVIAVANGIDLAKLSQVKEHSILLHESNSEGKDYGHLILTVQVHLPKIEGSVAALALQTLDKSSVEMLVRISSGCQSWQPFLQAFQNAVDLARQISELDPTAKIALGAVSFALKAVMKQMERDQRVNELQEIMTSLLLFFRDINTLRKSPFLQNVLGRLLRQVSECTYFIFQYQEIESFVQRTAIHLTTGTDAILDQFFATFTGLRAELALGTSLQAAINTEYILNKVNEIDSFLHINRLRYLEGSGWRTDKQYPGKTQDYTINQILQWISSFEPGLFVITGSPGSGKSATLHTLAMLLSNSGRLGACIFLNEHSKGEKTADSIMRTLLYYLALSNGALGRKIALAIAKEPTLVSVDAGYYQTLLKDVTGDLVLYGPIVIIVDGLHELENPQDQELLQTLLGQIAITAHDKLRFITSTRNVSTPDCGHVYWAVNHPQTASEECKTFIQTIWRVSSHSDDRPLESDCSMVDDLEGSIIRCSFGSPRWLELARDVLMCYPKAIQPFLGALQSFEYISTSEDDALDQLPTITSHIFHSIVFDYDFFHVAPGTRLFVTSDRSSKRQANHCPGDNFEGNVLPDSTFSSTPNSCLHELGLFRKLETSRVQSFDEYDMNEHVFSCLSRIFSIRANSLLPRSESPCNIYQIRLREASAAEDRGPVYARFALPASKPLRNGQKINDQLEPYGVYWSDLDKMAARSPPDGCEWIILHHELFPLEKKDHCTSVTVTTPVLTQAILERLTCIWAFWSILAREGTCLRLRDGREESKFLGRNSFSDVTYHETHAELVCDGERKGDLMPGDQIQVKSSDQSGILCGVIALALRY